MHDGSLGLQVDLVYDDACPNVTLARSNLRAAFELVGVVPKWSEHRVGDPNSPMYTHGYGSPTVLADGVDVAGTEAGSDACCRIYAAARRIAKAPSVDVIAAALTKAATS